MPELRNVRHETFASLIASGSGNTAAYREAGFRAVTGASVNASRLLKSAKVKARVSEILAHRGRHDEQAAVRAIEKTAITRASVLQMLVEDRDLARQRGQMGAAVRAAELLGKELGMFVERREQGRPGDFATMPKEELNRRLVDLLVARGMSAEEAQDFISGGRLRRRQGLRPGEDEKGSRPN